MNFRQPPKLAVWLLSFLGVNAGNAPLAGDLLEEFRSGRTAGWYWRQAVMAIMATFGQRLQAYRRDLLEMFAGWSAESSVPLALWIFNVPLGVRFLVMGAAILAIIGVVIYVDYRVRLHLSMNDGTRGEESHENWQRDVGSRYGVLLFFGYFVASDALVALTWILPGWRFGLPFVLICHACWLCRLAIQRLRRTS